MDSHEFLAFSNLQLVIYVAVIIFVLGLLLREVWNWYCKHNEMLSLMKEISEKLTKLDNSINKQNSNENPS